MAKKKLSIEDVLNDEYFENLIPKEKKTVVKTDEGRLIDSFQEINAFFEKHNREPEDGKSMVEYKLKSRLKYIREDEENKIILKSYDRYNLLGHVEMPESSTIDDILKDGSGLLNIKDDLSIYKFKHTPKPEDRAKTDFVAKRKPLSEKEFKPYERMFHQVHQEIKEGKRKLKPLINIEKNLKEKKFYVMSGVLLYLESAELEKSEWVQKSGNRVRLEGRTRTIFENGTYSNMLFRSLGKQIQKDGKLVTDTEESMEQELIENSNAVNEEDKESGCIYVLKSKSKNPQISQVRNLYKIGYSKTPVRQRINNASKEATYLYADIQFISSYKCYNLNPQVVENLIHRFFAEVCLNVDIEMDNGQRITPREWFVVPFEIIEEAINLILNKKIINYKYDSEKQSIILK